MDRRVAAVAILGVVIAMPAGATPPDDTVHMVEREANPVVKGRLCKSLAIGVRRGEERTERFYGNTGDGHPPDADTEYEIGSITKTFTGTLLAWAASKGIMQIEDPLALYAPTTVPGLKGHEITLLELANHTSGLGRDPPQWGRAVSESTMWAYVARYRLRSAPGRTYRYSNLGFGVLGLAIERTAGQPLEQLYSQLITDPLGMHNTALALSREQVARLARGYDDHGQPAPEGDYAFPALYAAAGLHSTLSDMMLYLDFQLGRIQSPLSSLLPVLREPRGLVEPGRHAGMGWEITTLLGGETLIDMDGAMYGFASYIGFVPSTQTGVVVLSNQQECPAWAIGPGLIKTMHPAPAIATAHRRAS